MTILDEEGSKNFMDQLHELWINPEIEKRKKEGKLSSDFKIYRCLIRMPKNSKPIVEFNDEIKWIAKVKIAKGSEIKEGDPVYLHDIENIAATDPPKVNGERVAFIYLFYNGISYQNIFDFTPNTPENMISTTEKDEWTLGEHIGESLQAILTEHAVRSHKDIQDLLKKIGLWAAPALLPYPLSKITFLLKNQNLDDAVKLLRKFCNNEFLDSICQKWWSLPQFSERKNLIIDALSVHKDSKYSLSIHALLPQLEGIITDWIYTQIPSEQVPWRQESKTKKFKDILSSSTPSTFVYKSIVESTIEFILGGPVLQTFNNWFDSLDNSFANRHILGHGKYIEDFYNEDKSIKMFLLLDTIYHIISNKN